MALRNKVRGCEIRRTPNAKPLLPIERSCLLRPSDQNDPGKIREALPAGYPHGKAT